MCYRDFSKLIVKQEQDIVALSRKFTKELTEQAEEGAEHIERRFHSLEGLIAQQTTVQRDQLTSLQQLQIYKKS